VETHQHPPSGHRILGNGYTMAIEKNNEQIADVIEAWIRDHVSKLGKG
jgi:hypothetical protein